MAWLHLRATASRSASSAVPRGSRREPLGSRGGGPAAASPLLYTAPPPSVQLSWFKGCFSPVPWAASNVQGRRWSGQAALGQPWQQKRTALQRGQLLVLGASALVLPTRLVLARLAQGRIQPPLPGLLLPAPLPGGAPTPPTLPAGVPLPCQLPAPQPAFTGPPRSHDSCSSK